MIKMSPRDAYLRLQILSRCLVDGSCDESMVRELSRYDTVGLARRPKFRRSGVSTATNGEPHEPKGCWSPGNSSLDPR